MLWGNSSSRKECPEVRDKEAQKVPAVLLPHCLSSRWVRFFCLQEEIPVAWDWEHWLSRNALALLILSRMAGFRGRTALRKLNLNLEWTQRTIYVGGDSRGHLVQTLPQNRVSFNLRWGCSGLCSSEFLLFLAYCHLLPPMYTSAGEENTFPLFLAAVCFQPLLLRDLQPLQAGLWPPDAHQ